ncbi:MAG TPA: molybdopterin molybdenumtransferase MoeA, partial [Thermoplasmata archaeon]|nr:molybdopterin molybdenumtransferase MoeA [Thermoplasmata archaeon]
MRPFGRLLSTDEALRRLLTATAPLTRTERLPVGEAVGRRSARRVAAPHPVPPFQRATWDGYAVRSADTQSATKAHPVRLRLLGDVFAETPSPRRVRAGGAV